MNVKLVSPLVAIVLASIAGMYWLFNLEAMTSVQAAQIINLEKHVIEMKIQFDSIDTKLDKMTEDVSFIKGKLE